MATRRKWIFYDNAMAALEFQQSCLCKIVCITSSAVISDGNERWGVSILTYIWMFCVSPYYTLKAFKTIFN